MVDDPVRLMVQPNSANIVAAELGMKTYGPQHIRLQEEGLPIPHTTTTTQWHGEVGRTIEWWGTDVGGDRTTGGPETGGQSHQWRTQARQDSDVGTDLVARATGGKHNADATRKRHPLATPQQLQP